MRCCVGAGLAVLEGAFAIEGLLARIPNYSMEHGARGRLSGYSNRGFIRGPMKFEVARAAAS